MIIKIEIWDTKGGYIRRCAVSKNVLNEMFTFAKVRKGILRKLPSWVGDRRAEVGVDRRVSPRPCNNAPHSFRLDAHRMAAEWRRRTVELMAKMPYFSIYFNDSALMTVEVFR